MTDAVTLPPITSTSTGVLLRLHVQPKASRTGIIGLHGDAIRIRLQAPPVDGAANEALVRFLAKTLRVSRSEVSIVAGAGGRQKRVAVAGIDVAHATKCLLPTRSSDSG